MEVLEISRLIQVYTGNHKKVWKDVKIISVIMEDVDVDNDGKPIKGISFLAEFEDGSRQKILGAFGLSRYQWRYKEKSCEQCKWYLIEGGDSVPYGSSTVSLPEGIVCDNPDMENIEIPYDETDGGKECVYFEWD